MIAMINKVLALLSALGCLFAIGVYIYTENIYKRPLPSESSAYKEFMEEIKNSSFKETFKSDALAINLPVQNSRLRFLSLQTEIEPLKPKYLEKFSTEFGRSLVNDSVIEVTSQMDPEELNTVSGKLLLEGRIKKSINEKFGKPVIRRIFFTKFVIQ